MTLPVSSYEELLARVRSLTSETIQLRRELTMSLFDYPDGGALTPAARGKELNSKSNNASYSQKGSSSSPRQNINRSAMESSLLSDEHLATSSSVITKKEEEMNDELKEVDEKRSSDNIFWNKNTGCRNDRNGPETFGLWHSGPVNLSSGQTFNGIRGDVSKVEPTAFTSSLSVDRQPFDAFSSAARTYSHQQFGVKVEMVYNLLSMLGTNSREDMSKTFLAMSSSSESCHAMRQSGCLPLLVQLIHSPELDGEVRSRAAEALRNIVYSQTDDKRRRREIRVLKLLQQIRGYCDDLKEKFQQGSKCVGRGDSEKHPATAMGALMKFSFDAEHRQAICTLGGLLAIIELIQVDHEAHGSHGDDADCLTLRRYAGMSLTNLTFGDGKNKALLCSYDKFMNALVDQLKSPSEDLRQVTASVLRNLSWRADSESKEALRAVGAVTALTVAAMEGKKESTLKSILSALWNLSAHCSTNKVDICSVPGSLAFLIKMLRYNSTPNTLAIIENAGGIIRNVSSHIAVREDYRQILRDNNCFEILLEQLKSPSLTIVSNACGTLWNLSARCAEDQKKLWEMGATGMLRNLIQSKHKMISMGSSAALKNLLTANPNGVLFNHLDSTARNLGVQNLPTLLVRKQRALEQEIDITLAETCENIESNGSPTQLEKPLRNTDNHNSFSSVLSDSRESIRSTKSDSICEKFNQVMAKQGNKMIDNKNGTLHESLNEKQTVKKSEDQKLMKRYNVSMIPKKKLNREKFSAEEETSTKGQSAEHLEETSSSSKSDCVAKERLKRGIPVLKARSKNKSYLDSQTADHHLSTNEFSTLEECERRQKLRKESCDVLKKCLNYKTDSSESKSQTKIADKVENISENFAFHTDSGENALNNNECESLLLKCHKSNEIKDCQTRHCAKADENNSKKFSALEKSIDDVSEKNAQIEIDASDSREKFDANEGSVKSSEKGFFNREKVENERQADFEKNSSIQKLPVHEVSQPLEVRIEPNSNPSPEKNLTNSESKISITANEYVCRNFPEGTSVDCSLASAKSSTIRFTVPETDGNETSICNPSNASNSIRLERNGLDQVGDESDFSSKRHYSSTTSEMEDRHFDDSTALNNRENCRETETENERVNRSRHLGNLKIVEVERSSPEKEGTRLKEFDEPFQVVPEREKMSDENFGLDFCVEGKTEDDGRLSTVVNGDNSNDSTDAAPDFRIGSEITNSNFFQSEAAKICREIKKYRDSETGNCSLNSQMSVISCSSFLDVGDYGSFDFANEMENFEASECAGSASCENSIGSPSNDCIGMTSLGSLKIDRFIDADPDLESSIISMASIASELAETNSNQYSELASEMIYKNYEAATNREVNSSNKNELNFPVDACEYFDDDGSLNSHENVKFCVESRKKLTPREKRKAIRDRYRTYTIRNIEDPISASKRNDGQKASIASAETFTEKMGFFSTGGSGMDGKWIDDRCSGNDAFQYLRHLSSGNERIGDVHDRDQVANNRNGNKVDEGLEKNQHDSLCNDLGSSKAKSDSFCGIRLDGGLDLKTAFFDSKSFNDLLNMEPDKRKELVDNAKLVALTLKTAVDESRFSQSKNHEIDTSTFNKTTRCADRIEFLQALDDGEGRDRDLGNDLVPKQGPKISKSLEKNKAVKEEESSKGVRGKRKKLYSSPLRKVGGDVKSTPNSPKMFNPKAADFKKYNFAAKSLPNVAKSVSNSFLPSALQREETFTKKGSRHFSVKTEEASIAGSRGKNGDSKLSAGRSKFGLRNTKSLSEVTNMARPVSDCCGKTDLNCSKGKSGEKRIDDCRNKMSKGNLFSSSKLSEPKRCLSSQNLKCHADGRTVVNGKMKNSGADNSKNAFPRNEKGKPNAYKKEVASKVAGSWKKSDGSKLKNTNLVQKNSKILNESGVLEQEEISELPSRSKIKNQNAAESSNVRNVSAENKSWKYIEKFPR